MEPQEHLGFAGNKIVCENIIFIIFGKILLFNVSFKNA